MQQIFPFDLLWVVSTNAVRIERVSVRRKEPTPTATLRSQQGCSEHLRSFCLRVLATTSRRAQQESSTVHVHPTANLAWTMFGSWCPKYFLRPTTFRNTCGMSPQCLTYLRFYRQCAGTARCLLPTSQVKSAPTPVGEPNVKAEAEKKSVCIYCIHE